MKVLIISDIHANMDALNAVWARESDADAILCAGDVVDWGLATGAQRHLCPRQPRFAHSPFV